MLAGYTRKFQKTLSGILVYSEQPSRVFSILRAVEYLPSKTILNKFYYTTIFCSTKMLQIRFRRTNNMISFLEILKSTVFIKQEIKEISTNSFPLRLTASY